MEIVKGRPKKSTRQPKTPHRPRLLGTDDIPPPLGVPYQMWSASSSPYEQGLVQFEFTMDGLLVQWYGIEAKSTLLRWHDLANLVEYHPKLTEDLQHIKEKAETEGYIFGLAKALERYGDKTTMPIGKPLLAEDLVDEK